MFNKVEQVVHKITTTVALNRKDVECALREYLEKRGTTLPTGSVSMYCLDPHRGFGGYIRIEELDKQDFISISVTENKA